MYSLHFSRFPGGGAKVLPRTFGRGLASSEHLGSLCRARKQALGFRWYNQRDLLSHNHGATGPLLMKAKKVPLLLFPRGQ